MFEARRGLFSFGRAMFLTSDLIGKKGNAELKQRYQGPPRLPSPFVFLPAGT